MDINDVQGFAVMNGLKTRELLGMGPPTGSPA